MIYIHNKSNRADFNIAFEEYCFKKLRKYDKIFLLWKNEPSIIVGKHQNVFEEINADFVKEKNIKIVRRISGGGAVYHDLQNLNYTIISNENDNEKFDFKTFSEPVIDALAELGVKAEFLGQNNLQVAGKKICGNAQAYIKGRIMHHGCLLFNTNLTVLNDALKVPKAKISSKSAKSVRSVVQNIQPLLNKKIDIGDFSDRILQQMKMKFPQMREYKLTKEELAEIEEETDKKYSTWNWNIGKSPKSEITLKENINKKEMICVVKVENGIITSLLSDSQLIKEVESNLIGVKYEKEEIQKVLQKMNVADLEGTMKLIII